MAEISTVQKLWIISLDELSKKYGVANQRAMHALQMYGSSKVILQDDGSLGYPSDVAEECRRQGLVPEPLSINKKLFLRRYYEGKVQEICTTFQFPHKIQATSIMFRTQEVLSKVVCNGARSQDNLVGVYILGLPSRRQLQMCLIKNLEDVNG